MRLSELIDSVDILEYISQYVEFEERNGEYWGLSPLRAENTPSFSVDTEKQCFYDFSSGKGGNIITFISLYNECGTTEAGRILSAYVGDAGIQNRHREMGATRIAKRFARKRRTRKEPNPIILTDDHMERYEKRDDKLAIWVDEGIARASLERFDVRYDSLSDRLVYPIRNIDGRIINVHGRTVDENWKEKKLRKYTYFHPLGTLNTVYGIAENREEIIEKREVIIFEGAKSVFLAHTWGIYNTAALLTSHLNSNQLKILARLGIRTVFALDKGVVVRDDDNIRKLSRYVSVEYLQDNEDLLEDKMSPVDKGKDVFEKLFEGRKICENR